MRPPSQQHRQQLFANMVPCYLASLPAVLSLSATAAGFLSSQ
ncbi:MAG TPA: hypothetical protein PLV33_03990 [Opitutaceae bacterium]|nr:hypothetical protein [Opitutaceae bacterium]HOR24226.1 hypothetical protein [Opitutaceae bacterium]HPK48993.1 hypothetical protein [Opitutaceae bacterium]